MRFQYQCIEDLPKLSWLAIVEKGKDFVEVIHGASVECLDTFFVAGVWDGDFSDGNFSETSFSSCTGGVLKKTNGGVIFSTPNHPQEMLFSFREEEKLYISNSAAFILARTGNELDVDYYNYEKDFCSCLLGVEHVHRSTPLKGGQELYIHLCCNLIIDSSLIQKEERKRTNMSFKNYDDYYSSLIKILQKISLNAQDEHRKTKYGSISTISKGYDATAASVLAQKMGCDTVLTFNRPRQYESDCGTDIARIIGYKHIVEGDADLYKHNKQKLEAEATATGDVGSMTVFTAYEDLYKNKLVWMGCRGDSVWEKEHGNVNDHYDFSEGNTLAQASISYKENFLKNNAVMIMPPLIGADRWSEIAQISKSEEMRGFSMGNDYDRPIPRRIVETEGVAREAFGQKKKGAGISYHFDTLGRLKHKMSSHSYESLLEFRSRLRRKRFPFLMHTLRFYASEMPVYINYLLNRFGAKFFLNVRDTGTYSSPISTLLILWGMDEMIKRYKSKKD